MRKQYHLWPAAKGFDAWGVDRLIILSRGLPVHAVAVDSAGEAGTVRAVVEHARLMLDADLSFPVILALWSSNLRSRWPSRTCPNGRHGAP